MIACYIKNLMKQRGITQIHIAEYLNSNTGKRYNQSMISKRLNGISKFCSEEIWLVFQLLNIRYEEVSDFRESGIY